MEYGEWGIGNRELELDYNEDNRMLIPYLQFHIPSTLLRILFHVPYSLFLAPYSLFFAPYSLFPPHAKAAFTISRLGLETGILSPL